MQFLEPSAAVAERCYGMSVHEISDASASQSSSLGTID